MEVYILDSLYRRSFVIDKAESLIWTERFAAWGDFELDLFSTLETRSLLKIGQRLAIKESYRVMTIETIEDSTDDDGRAMLKIKGRSLESYLENRLARAAFSDLTTTPKWILTGLPVAIINKIFHDVCITGVLNAGDIIPGVTEASIFPTDTISAPSTSITYEIEPMTVYKAIKDLADIYSIGFRLVRNLDTSQLYWDVYMGSDRTTSQTALPAVVFSPGLDNLQNTTELSSSAGYKNVAYVLSPVGYEIVYSSEVDSTVSGFDRRVLIVKADDITDTDPAVATLKMTRRGNEELAKNRRFFGFDGELSQYSKYTPGVHYNLGDLVELRNNDGASTTMQVTEQIYVSDKEGVRSYPTLSVNTFITPGSWLSWDFNQEWDDLDSTTYWEDQP